MATATMDPPPSSKAIPILRRASYVNVDKLVRSQYDIDLQLLTEELAKLKATEHNNEAEHDGGADEGDNSPGGEGARSAGAKPNAWSGTNLSVLPGGPLRAPLPGKYHQSRLQPPRDGFNLCLLVGKVELVVDKYRVDGSRVLVAEVEVGDETGSISLRARDEQIDLLRQVSNDGGAIVLRNCTMELYQGKHLRLAVSKWGKMTVYPDGIESTPNPPSSMNQELNFSLVDLNIVARTKMPDEPQFPMPVANVHHKPQKQHQHAQKNFDESPSRGTPRNRNRSQGGHYSHQRKKKDDWQYNRQHQQQRRPRSDSHNSHNMNAPAGGQYLLPHQQSGGSPSPPQSFPVPQQMHYPQYNDASSAYSYPQYQQQDQQGGSPHRQFLPEDHYKRQQHIFQQQHEMQQMHAHQMNMLLQQQQQTQRMMLEQQQQQQRIPGRSRAESHESGGGEYSIHSTPGGAMGQHSLQLGPGTFPPTPTMQPNPSTSQPMAPPQHPGMYSEYQYGSQVSSPFQGEGQQQPQGSMCDVPTYATIISPPMSPTHTSHPAPQAPPQYPDGRLDGQYSSENQK
mmetsp:Transcript_23479/g.50871  ORF Transcript_23479/g.50871 Transcript_23479/m.50871 type:complete len:565 (+) Transcript_23479:129-1823(+)|eukprot:CAMPEP_0172302208 /NCGR_PEP_ID=MMETSP1058-20130122/3949_1 /TAXON_ID=83371 /ORGANISM="Detonula confervacea, Strain CCMP 353" /LENGTH=564 /DNA_ID=CAMNT_0013012605 /DNA_START=46 /DNA_END=1740 /DNA_ORIENTATION=-